MPAQAIADGYENSMLFYEHTWGGAIDWIGKYSPAQNHIGQISNWHYGDQWKAELKTRQIRPPARLLGGTHRLRPPRRKIASASLHEGMEALANAVDVRRSAHGGLQPAAMEARCHR